MINPKWLGLSIVYILKTLIKEKAEQIMLDGKAIKSTDAIDVSIDIWTHFMRGCIISYVH